jgi:hypothetical protein
MRGVPSWLMPRCKVRHTLEDGEEHDRMIWTVLHVGTVQGEAEIMLEANGDTVRWPLTVAVEILEPAPCPSTDSGDENGN